VTDERVLRRVKALVIPPAWTDVWIAVPPQVHIQAIGSDADGRRQYIYHPLYRAAREQEKFQRLLPFGAMLPRIREWVAEDMAAKGLPRGKILATVVHLLDRTLIRIGNRAYAEANASFGLSTLRSRRTHRRVPYHRTAHHRRVCHLLSTQNVSPSSMHSDLLLFRATDRRADPTGSLFAGIGSEARRDGQLRR
jgi:hypothetical protein